MARLSTFDDWIDLFDKWQKDVGLDRALNRPERLSQVRCDTSALRSTGNTLDAPRSTHRPFEIPPGRRSR